MQSAYDRLETMVRRGRVHLKSRDCKRVRRTWWAHTMVEEERSRVPKLFQEPVGPKVAVTVRVGEGCRCVPKDASELGVGVSHLALHDRIRASRQGWMRPRMVANLDPSGFHRCYVGTGELWRPRSLA